MGDRTYGARNRRSAALFIALASILGVAAYLYAPFLIAGAVVPVTFGEADLNHDGAVSFTEAEYIASSGRRTYSQRGKTCTEFFAYKDGLPLKTLCQ